MSTSLLARSLVAAAACGLLASGATAARGGTGAGPAIELQSGGHLKVLTAYLRESPQAMARGMVRRDPLWRGPVGGHLHVIAYGADGQVIAQRATTWSGRFTTTHPAAAYQADLAVPRADVARLKVSVAPGRHSASESFQ